MKPAVYFSLCLLIGNIPLALSFDNKYIDENLQSISPVVDLEFVIGDKWIYETVYYVTGDFKQIDFDVIEITDTTFIDGQQCYRLSNTDVFYVEDDKMYFWDEGLETFEMYYDFNSDQDYTIRYFDQFIGDTLFAEIKVDSVYDVILNDTIVGARDISVFGSNSHPDGWEGTIYDNIGIGWDGPKIDLDCGLCDPTVFITELRCFESEPNLLNFKTYGCDSTFSIDTSPPDVDHLPIINSGQTWIGQTTGFEPSQSFQYSYSEDSVFLGNNYYHERIQSNKEDGSEPYSEGYYRESLGKLYKRIEDNDHIVLDMNLKHSDVIIITQDYETSVLTVVSVDTVTYDDNISRKRIKLECLFSESGPYYWVEGIGELYPATYCVLDGTNSNLRCVLDQNGDRIYSTIDENENCWITTSTQDIFSQKLSVYPNPATSSIILSGFEREIEQGSIYNSYGQLMSIFYTDQIDVSTFPSGVYMIKVLDKEGNIYSSKFVKSK